MTDEELQEMIDEVDRDGDGEVNMILRAASYFTDKESAGRERCLVWPLAA